MTKLRAPDSIEDAVTQAIGLLGAETIAMALSSPTGRTVSASLLRKWADPDNGANRIDGQMMTAIELLLIKTGHEPVFGPLFERLRPLGPALGAPVDPVATAVQATINAAELLRGVRDAVRDGGLQWPEVAALRAQTQALQKELAALNRALVVKPRTTQQARN